MNFAKAGRGCPSVLVLTGLSICCAATANAQTDTIPTADATSEGQRDSPSSQQARPNYVRPLDALLKSVIEDQKRIWTSPSHLRKRDFTWLVPLAGAAGFLIATDERNMKERFHSDARAQDRSQLVSNLGFGAIASIPAYLYWYGWKHSDEHAQTTALLSARAATNSIVAAQLVHLLTWRERPMEATGSGRFEQSSSFSSSFPSMHSAAVWAMAPVIAERYPGWLTKIGVYSLASAVSLSRVTAREHFPSDVLVGSAMGWLVGHYVANPQRLRLTDPFPRPAQANQSPRTDDGPKGSPYVPLDSWIYSALDRLSAVGLIPTQMTGIRPWTRAECLRQVTEADDEIKNALDPSSSIASMAMPLLAELHHELDEAEPGRAQVVLDTVYVRNGVIAGPVLNNSYHFGQTWINNSGRPFGRGWNADAGFSVRAESGRFFGYFRGEYQHAPGQDAYPLATRQLIATLDSNPVQAPEAVAETNRFRPMEAYVGMRLSNLELSVGKQALWWGPTYDAPLMFSDNAEPTKNAKISMVHPYLLPGFLRYLGEVRTEFVFGKLGGQKYTWRPWFNAQKISIKLTENLELGFTRASVLWGVGHPITLNSFGRSILTYSSSFASGPYDPRDPGDRKTGFDFRYRLPGLRNWLTLYSDSYSDDDPSPLIAPPQSRAAISPGIYLTHVPGIPKLDFRVEAASTTPLTHDWGGQFMYYNNQYHSANTNYGNLIGSWVGRDGRAIEGWSTYWLSARSKVQAGYRQWKASSLFLPGGGTKTDATLKFTVKLPQNWYADAMLQYERFYIPALGGPQRNVSSWVQLKWEPKLQLLGK